MTLPADPLWRRAWRALAPTSGAAGPPPAAGPRPAPVAAPRLGGFVLQRRIAHSAGSTLYASVDPDLGTPVAVKVMDLGLAGSTEADDAAERFLQAGRAALGLKHPHIVALHEVRVIEAQGVIVMELLPGSDLSRYTRPARLLPEPVVLRTAARVAAALAFAHAAGVVHRDIKPANIMVDVAREQVKVTDFGIARVMDGSRSRSGVIAGTPMFMAPEQLAGAALDGRADLYALGVVLQQLLTGRLPYDATSMGELLRQVAQGRAVDLGHLRPDLPADLLALVRSLMQADPHRRPSDGAQVAQALQDIAHRWTGPGDVGDWRHNPSPP